MKRVRNGIKLDNLYAYGLRARPLDIGTVPRDYCGFDTSYRNEESRVRHGVVFYTRELSAKEVVDFELILVDICELKEYNTETWN
jgi:hypothetical protein